MTESPSGEIGAAEARAALDAVQATQRGVGERLVVPRGYDPLYGLAAGVLVVGIALVNAEHHQVEAIAAGVALFGAGFATLAGLMRWFRRVNGVWVSGLTPPRARWVAWASGIAVGVGVFLGSLASSQGHWGLLVLVAGVTAVACTLLSRLWLAVYRAETKAA